MLIYGLYDALWNLARDKDSTDKLHSCMNYVISL